MRTTALTLAASAFALAAPAAAGGDPAVVLQTELPCYLSQQTVRITGSGFHPGAAYTVTLDHRAIGSGSVRTDGTVSGTLSSGVLPTGANDVHHRVRVSDGTQEGQATFHVTGFTAAFHPAVGDPRTLRVRYSLYGIGLSAPPHSIVFLHYLDPRGHLRKTVGIGYTRGPCGSLPASIAHRLFPFRTSSGTWRLQFDLAPGYSRRSQPRLVREVVVG
jgi:hypothetical protein